MITITLGTVADMQTLAHDLLQEHYEELTLHKDVVKLNPDADKYYKLEQLGMVTVFLAKHDAKLVGYSVFIVHNSHMHYKDIGYAANDILFVTKPYRTASTAGLQLIKFADKWFKEKYVKSFKILYHIKAANDFSKVLMRYGYGHEETIMGKILR